MTESSQVLQIKMEKRIAGKFGEFKAQKTELREYRKQLRDTFDQDKDFHDLSLIVKDQKAKLTARKLALEDENPSIKTLEEKIETLKEGVKSTQLTLSDWLIEYKEKIGSDTIPDDIGEIVKIEVKKTAKAVKV